MAQGEAQRNKQLAEHSPNDADGSTQSLRRCSRPHQLVWHIHVHVYTYVHTYVFVCVRFLKQICQIFF